MYPVHVSGDFLLPSTLASALYLVLLFVGLRRYRDAHHILQSCVTDAHLTEEELYHFRQLHSDGIVASHPDFYALLLRVVGGAKLDAARFYAFFTMSWQHLTFMHTPNAVLAASGDLMEAYLGVASHVSNFCRLSVDEERQLLDSSKHEWVFSTVPVFTFCFSSSSQPPFSALNTECRRAMTQGGCEGVAAAAAVMGLKFHGLMRNARTPNSNVYEQTHWHDQGNGTSVGTVRVRIASMV